MFLALGIYTNSNKNNNKNKKNNNVKTNISYISTSSPICSESTAVTIFGSL